MSSDLSLLKADELCCVKMTMLGIEPGPPDPKSSRLTINTTAPTKSITYVISNIMLNKEELDFMMTYVCTI